MNKKIRFIFNRLPIKGLFLLAFSNSGYLKKKGCLKSSFKKDAVDNFGNPVPWLTYPFMAFIKNRIQYEMKIFEYGSGASTIWFSESVKHLVSVENNISWYLKTKPLLHKNVTYILSELDTNLGYLASCFLNLGEASNYAKEILEFEEKFDVILVDGVDRLNCIACGIEKLRGNCCR